LSISDTVATRGVVSSVARVHTPEREITGRAGGVDANNVLNNVVLLENQNFGSSLGQPQRFLQGRLARLTAQITF